MVTRAYQLNPITRILTKLEPNEIFNDKAVSLQMIIFCIVIHQPKSLGKDFLDITNISEDRCRAKPKIKVIAIWSIWVPISYEIFLKNQKELHGDLTMISEIKNLAIIQAKLVSISYKIMYTQQKRSLICPLFNFRARLMLLPYLTKNGNGIHSRARPTIVSLLVYNIK